MMQHPARQEVPGWLQCSAAPHTVQVDGTAAAAALRLECPRGAARQVGGQRAHAPPRHVAHRAAGVGLKRAVLQGAHGARPPLHHAVALPLIHLPTVGARREKGRAQCLSREGLGGRAAGQLAACRAVQGHALRCCGAAACLSGLSQPGRPLGPPTMAWKAGCVAVKNWAAWSNTSPGGAPLRLQARGDRGRAGERTGVRWWAASQAGWLLCKGWPGGAEHRAQARAGTPPAVGRGAGAKAATHAVLACGAAQVRRLWAFGRNAWPTNLGGAQTRPLKKCRVSGSRPASSPPCCVCHPCRPHRCQTPPIAAPVSPARAHTPAR